MMATAETPEKGYPRKKVTIFFKSGETKTGCSGDKLGRVNFFSDFFKNGGTKPVQPGEKLGRGEKFRISSKMMVVNGARRERNLMGTQWR